MDEEGKKVTNDDEDEPFEWHPTIKKWAVGALWVIGILWVIYFVAAAFGVNGIGEHGDTFGSLNALFSGLAFAGVIVTIMMQSQELKAQRQELKNSVEAQRDQAKATKRLHEQAEERTRQEHAIRVLAAYQEWQSAGRKVWQAITHYLTCEANDVSLPAEWSRRAEEAIVSLEAAVDTVDALDPDQLPIVNWQRIVENGLANKIAWAKQADEEFKKCIDTFSMAALRLRKHLPKLGD